VNAQAKRLGMSSADGAGGSDVNSLHALIQRNKASRQSQMDSLLSAMEAKYSAMGDDDVIDMSTGRKVRPPAATKGKTCSAAGSSRRSTSGRAAKSRVKAKHSH